MRAIQGFGTKNGTALKNKKDKETVLFFNFI
jgi:hypothetical protein